jgi:hypothetical protein
MEVMNLPRPPWNNIQNRGSRVDLGGRFLNQRAQFSRIGGSGGDALTITHPKEKMTEPWHPPQSLIPFEKGDF